MVTYQDITKAYEKLNYSISFKELDAVFFISDAVQTKEFISPQFNRVLARRIVDYFAAWANTFHRLLMPNPNSIVDLEESKTLDDSKRDKINLLLFKIMELTSRNSKIELQSTKELENQFLKDALTLRNKELVPFIDILLTDINGMWKNKKIEKEQQHKSYGGVS